jgi:hypothetical protein
LLYELKSLPNEYEIDNVKQCEQMAEDELNISIAMCILGALPFLYFVIKRMIHWISHGCKLPRFILAAFCHKKKALTVLPDDHYSMHSSHLNRKKSSKKDSVTFRKFESKLSMSSLQSGANSARSDYNSSDGYDSQFRPTGTNVIINGAGTRLSAIQASIDIIGTSSEATASDTNSEVGRSFEAAF